jgi:hypothetical protein
MKKHYIAVTFVIALLSACQSQTNQNEMKSPSSISSPQTTQTPSLPSEAKKECGDPLPPDPKAYPVNFYPVSVEYSDRNLELVKKHFCQDARKMLSKSLGKEVLQVASFTSREKAQAFKEELSQHFSQSRVGDPTIVEKLKSDVSDRKAEDENLDTVESIAKVALLSPEQVQQLLDLEKSTMFYAKGRSKDIEVGKVKALVPTYIPSGFKLTEFSRISSTPKSEYDQRYKLRYESSIGESFEIANFEMLGDGPAFIKDAGRIEHPLLGQIRLWYTQRDRMGSTRELSFQAPYTLFYQGKGTGYYFYSGGRLEKSKIVNMEEAIRIVNSLKPLNPKTQFDYLPGRAKWSEWSN